jgi:hypothetical protein
VTRASAGRWLALLAGVYVAGTALGAVAAPLFRPAVQGPIALAEASPTPTVTQAPAASVTLTPMPATPAATPPPTPAATPAATPSPTVATTPTGAPEPTPTAAATRGADPADLPAFVTDLGDALDHGRGGFLFDHLHPAVIERYGAAACRSFTATARVDGLSLTYVDSSGPAPWDWELDGLSTTIEDGWIVTVVWQQPGTNEQRDLHVAPHDGAWRWFTDCGDPLST